MTLEEFKKVELKTARILEASEIPGTDRIWKLLVDLGTEKREIVAGIKVFYAKEALIGRTVVIVQNLAPAIIRGVESRGMLLAAKDPSGTLSLITTDRETPPGSSVG